MLHVWRPGVRRASLVSELYLATRRDDDRDAPVSGTDRRSATRATGKGGSMKTVRQVSLLLLCVSLVAVVAPRPARAFDVLLQAQGEFLDAYLVNGNAFPPKFVFVDPDPPDPDSLATPPRVGRHLNGRVCFIPRRSGRPTKFVIADDTYRE